MSAWYLSPSTRHGMDRSMRQSRRHMLRFVREKVEPAGFTVRKAAVLPVAKTSPRRQAEKRKARRACRA